MLFSTHFHHYFWTAQKGQLVWQSCTCYSSKNPKPNIWNSFCTENVFQIVWMFLYSPSERSRSTSSNSFFSLFGSKVQSPGPWAKLGNVNTNNPLLFLLVYLKSEKEAPEIPEDNLVSHVLSWRQSGSTSWSCDWKAAVGSFQGMSQGWRSQDSYLLTNFIYSVRKTTWGNSFLCDSY